MPSREQTTLALLAVGVIALPWLGVLPLLIAAAVFLAEPWAKPRPQATVADPRVDKLEIAVTGIMARLDDAALGKALGGRR